MTPELDFNSLKYLISSAELVEQDSLAFFGDKVQDTEVFGRC